MTPVDTITHFPVVTLARYVPPTLVNPALRLLWRELRQGVTADQVHDWERTTWWPWLRTADEVLAIRDTLTQLVPVDGRWADPQIVVRLPTPDDAEVGPLHVDQEPPWADPDERYSAIIGVHLTASDRLDAPLLLATGQRIAFGPSGTVVILRPDIAHAVLPHLGHSPRLSLYFRHLIRVGVGG